MPSKVLGLLVTVQALEGIHAHLVCCSLARDRDRGGGTAFGFGQVATGVPPFSSNGGGSFDTVDNANLNVHFSIPIVAKAGRGLPFDYILSFDSSIWSPQAGAWTPATTWGWGGATDGATGEVTYAVTPMVCYTQGDPPRPYTYYEYSSLAYVDASGTTHPVHILISNFTSTPCNGGGPPVTQTASPFDGSGYVMDARAVGPWASVYAPNGDTILPPTRGQPGSGSITDANGNELSFAAGSTTTFTDTLGVTALTVSGAGTPASPMAYAYPNPSGGTSQVTVNYTAYAVGTDFGCSGVGEFKPAMLQAGRIRRNSRSRTPSTRHRRSRRLKARLRIPVTRNTWRRILRTRHGVRKRRSRTAARHLRARRRVARIHLRRISTTTGFSR